ncbi:MAG TPA: SMR family transporter [Chitinophagaceae bacterium]|nr:SMR family transporter [Chitinophagaceae bacterium]
MNLPFLLLLISAFCEAVWNIFLTKSKGIGDWGVNAIAIFFLIAGILTFKKALAGTPLSIAIVIWSGLSLSLTIFFDIYIFKTKVDWRVAFFMIMCILSIMGLNYYSKNN